MCCVVHTPILAHLPLTLLCGLPLLFSSFQVNNGLWYFLDYLQDFEWWSCFAPHPLTFLETLTSAC